MLLSVGELGPHVTQCHLSRGPFLRTKWHLDPSNRLATVQSRLLPINFMRQLWGVVQSLTSEAVKSMVNAFVSNRLDYCNSLLYGITDTQLQRLQSVQNAAARLVTGTRRSEHITPVLRSLHWLPAYHVQGRHHCPRMSKWPCSSVHVQCTYSVMVSCGPACALCQRGPTARSSEVANCNRRPVVQRRWTTSLEHSTCFCS